MTKITSYQNLPIQLTVDKKIARSGETTPNVAQSVTGGSNPVNITGQAKQLASLAQTLQNQPAVDELRVAELRNAIQEGSYQIDPQRIADKLLRFEQELGA